MFKKMFYLSSHSVVSVLDGVPEESLCIKVQLKESSYKVQVTATVQDEIMD